jgi:hypothetical protein
LFIVVHTGIYLLSWPSPRYRLPVDAVSMIFAALAVRELARLLISWSGRPATDYQLVSKPGEQAN